MLGGASQYLQQYYDVGLTNLTNCFRTKPVYIRIYEGVFSLALIDFCVLNSIWAMGVGCGPGRQEGKSAGEQTGRD
jgi:hypothetical protein